MKMLRLLFLGFLLVSGSAPLCTPASASPDTTMAADCPEISDTDTNSRKSESKHLGSNIICHACAISVADAAPMPSTAIWDKSEPIGSLLAQLESATQSPPTPPPKIV